MDGDNRLLRAMVQEGSRGMNLVLGTAYTPTVQDKAIYDLIETLRENPNIFMAHFDVEESTNSNKAGDKFRDFIVAQDKKAKRIKARPTPYLQFYCKIVSVDRFERADAATKDRLYSMMEADAKAYQLANPEV